MAMPSLWCVQRATSCEVQGVRKEAWTVNFRRWKLEKYDFFTGKLIPITPPEPLWLFWTQSGAIAQEIRLNSGLTRAHSRSRYRVVKR